ncbi:HAD family hydrolase [Desulfogranum japonicum]|uniref:HAD family hydrolase n=1 Tax=Desulfogranum japonicum TaxID=231447 RepID=UPI00041D2147|nr:HAD hydrolase-like protein [Desulfogranum japonicum]
MSIQWQAVFFDFDGVIARSVAVKTRAFRQLFSQYGEDICHQVVQYHLDNGGMPRSEKIRYYLTELLGQHPDEQEIDRIGQQFSQLVVDEVIQAPFIPGAMESLTSLQQQKIPAFVVSGTPHAEMNLIVEQKGLAPYFQEVHGSPRAKHVIVSEILEKYSFQPTASLFIGDAMADYKAAQRTGIQFLGIVPPDADNIFPKETTTSEKVQLEIL